MPGIIAVVPYAYSAQSNGTGSFFRDIHVVSGTTIMGDGRVALILDVSAVVRLADRLGRTAV